MNRREFCKATIAATVAGLSGLAPRVQRTALPIQNPLFYGNCGVYDGIIIKDDDGIAMATGRDIDIAP